jgi:hypothetical protein
VGVQDEVETAKSGMLSSMGVVRKGAGLLGDGEAVEGWVSKAMVRPLASTWILLQKGGREGEIFTFLYSFFSFLSLFLVLFVKVLKRRSGYVLNNIITLLEYR